MNKLATFALTALVATTASVATVRGANAEEICSRNATMSFCGTPGSSSDSLTVDHYRWGTERITISCAYGEYSANSRGSWTQSQLEFFADSYCEGRGYNAHN